MGKSAVACALAALICLTGQRVEGAELLDLSLEQLLNVELVSASKYNQPQSRVPAAVTVIGADQIKGYGYRTLGDALRSVPGMLVSSDRIYDNLAVRGVTDASNFNGRILVMIDGYRLNEAIYDSGTVGSEFPLDMDLVERVEIVRGPASSIYGSNAFFSVVNVIAKKGRDLQGGELAGAYGGFDTYKGRFSYGRKQDNGLEYLISASGLNSRGPDLYYPEFEADGPHGGKTSGTNDEYNKQFFAKAGYGDFSLTGGWGRRNRGVPGGAFGTNFDDPANTYQDSHGFMQAQYQTSLADKLNFTARAWFGDYDFRGAYIYGDIDNIDLAHATWSGLELRLLSTHFDGHHLTGGIEAQKNWTQTQDNYDDLWPRVTYLNDRRASHRIGVYMQDDIALTDTLDVSLGLRFDDYSLSRRAALSPKAGLSWRPFDGGAFKLLYGESFRSPTVWHQFYAYAPYFETDRNGNLTLMAQGRKPDPRLLQECAQTVQGTWEQRIGGTWLARGTVYHIWMTNLFKSANLDPAYVHIVNGPSQNAWGGEFELERRWSGGASLRASYSLLYAQDRQGRRLNDSPRHLFKLNALTPSFGPKLQAGLEILGLSPRHSDYGKTGGYALANLTLNWRPHPALDLSASVYNLLDNDYRDPLYDDGVAGRKGAPADGRDFRVKLEYRF